MGPRLVSLALLLLALCRQSSASPGYTIESVNTKSSTSTNSIAFSGTPPAEKKKALEKSQNTVSALDEAAQTTLMNLLGNSILLIGFTFAGILEKMPENIGKSIVKGMFCEVTGDLNDRIMKIPGYKREDETKAVSCDKLKNAGSTDGEKAANKVTYDCFCKDQTKSLVYCLVFSMKEAIMSSPEVQKFESSTKCRKLAFADLSSAGSGELAKQYDLDDFGKDNFNDWFSASGVDKITKNEDAAMARLFCDAIDPQVEKAVIGLYASDGVYWILETLLYTIVFGSPDKPLTQICQEPDFASNPYGQCVCRLNTGFSFCIYKVFGEIFKKAGFITCEAEKKFVPEKKAAVTALPQLVKRGSLSSPAAASSLLLAPASIAAAMLMLRH